jgi:hypothetical protein
MSEQGQGARRVAAYRGVVSDGLVVCNRRVGLRLESVWEEDAELLVPIYLGSELILIDIREPCHPVCSFSCHAKSSLQSLMRSLGRTKGTHLL